MSRDLGTDMDAAIAAGVVIPAVLGQIVFASSTQYVWTGYGNLSWNGNTFKGIGTLAGLAPITERLETRADGTSVSLSGIDPTLYGASMEDIQLGAPANIWLAFLTEGTVIGTPYTLFSGQVDKPTVTTGPEDITISLALESRLTNLQRPNARRYTLIDQRRYFPTCTAMSWVELLNDIALRWGS